MHFVHHAMEQDHCEHNGAGPGEATGPRAIAVTQGDERSKDEEREDPVERDVQQAQRRPGKWRLELPSGAAAEIRDPQSVKEGSAAEAPSNRPW
jgi:hypothetical protein